MMDLSNNFFIRVVVNAMQNITNRKNLHVSSNLFRRKVMNSKNIVIRGNFFETHSHIYHFTTHHINATLEKLYQSHNHFLCVTSLLLSPNMHTPEGQE